MTSTRTFSAIEKRKLPRLKLLFHLRVFDRVNFKLLGHLADIHSKGMMVISEQPQTPDQIHQVKLILPEPIENNYEIHFSAQVVWCKKHINPIFHQAGFKMAQMDQRCIRMIGMLVNQFGFHSIFQSKVVPYYRGIEGYNCAQAILKALHQNFCNNEELLEEFAEYGGGLAPNGICGALYAIQQLSRNPLVSKSFERQFRQEVGSTQCDEILTMGRLSCTGCIFTAFQIFHTHSDKALVKTGKAV